MTKLNPRPVPLPSQLMQQALRAALIDANMSVSDLDALIAVPSLAEPRFMVIRLNLWAAWFTYNACFRRHIT